MLFVGFLNYLIIDDPSIQELRESIGIGFDQFY